MSPRERAARIDVTGFPRVSGDEPHPATVCTVVWMFSPRERG